MQRVMLIACAKDKAASPAPARELYRSDVFRKARDLAERIATARGDSVMAQRVRELVAEHGIGTAGPASSKQEQALDALANDGLVAELERQPDAWAVFAEVKGAMSMQWPPRLTREDAERDAERLLPGVRTEVRPMYAGPADHQKVSPEGAQA